MSGSLPLVMTDAGPQPTPPATLLAQLLALAVASSPGLTASLPALLIEDISSTDTAALVVMDQARVDAVNAVTPYGANGFVVSALGQQAGIPQGTETNTSVYLVFTGSVGYVIPAGFLVTDGTYQYAVQDGGIIQTGGMSASLYAVAVQSGSWAVAANTVTSLVSSVASGYSLMVTNPLAGIPGGPAETLTQYQARVIQAGKAPAIGVPTALKTALQAVAGVIPRLVSVPAVGNGYEVICGGGDPYAVANAIYMTVLNIATLQGSATSARNVSVTIYDAPNNYTIIFVNPPQQVVTIAATWNTNLANFTAGAAVNAAAAPALAVYINSIPVGQPINLLEAINAFQEATATILPTISLTTLTCVVTINGTIVGPTSGTYAIPSDPETYFYCSASGATSVQG